MIKSILEAQFVLQTWSTKLESSLTVLNYRLLFGIIRLAEPLSRVTEF